MQNQKGFALPKRQIICSNPIYIYLHLFCNNIKINPLSKHLTCNTINVIFSNRIEASRVQGKRRLDMLEIWAIIVAVLALVEILALVVALTFLVQNNEYAKIRTRRLLSAIADAEQIIRLYFEIKHPGSDGVAHHLERIGHFRVVTDCGSTAEKQEASSQIRAHMETLADLVHDEYEKHLLQRSK